MAKKRPFNERAAEVLAVLPEYGAGKMTHREIVAALESSGKADSVEVIYPMLLTKQVYCRAEVPEDGSRIVVWYSRLPVAPTPAPTPAPVAPIPSAPAAVKPQ